jgi:ADP-ribose pyrophosphatase YjhB (NUDIX family)
MYALSNPKLKKLVHAVQTSLSDDLRKPQYRGHENCLAGHCYVASEALYHLLGGAESGWVPQNIQHEGGPHWYLKHKISGTILDPTASQFKTKVPYENGRGKGFLTKQPSKRTQVVLDRIKNEGLSLPVQKSESELTAAFKNTESGQIFATGSFHDVDKIPNYQPQQYVEGFVDPSGNFYNREEAKSLAKNQPPPVFPGFGVPDDRRETMPVNTQQALTMKLRQFANNAHKQEGNIGPVNAQAFNEFVQSKKKVAGSSSIGPTINSYALGTSLRPKATPKVVAGTMQHEDTHNIFNRIQQKHGETTRKLLSTGLLAGLRAVYPQFHHAVQDFIKVRNGENYNPDLRDEEVIAHTVNYLNNPQERIRYHSAKGHDLGTAHAFDSVMKRGYKVMRQLATDMDPSWLGKTRMAGVYEVPLQELDDVPAIAWDKGRTSNISALMDQGKDLGPIAVAQGPDGLRELEDGNHRLHLARQKGRPTIKVRYLSDEAAAVNPQRQRGSSVFPHAVAPVDTIAKSDANPAIPDMPSDHCQAFVVAEQMVRQCKKPVKASGLCYLHLAKIGHFFDAENEKQKKVEVSSIAVFNSEGYLLMGIREDSGKYTLPGGKADSGESPEACARRELWEEAGLKIKALEHLGSGWGGKNGDVRVSVFRGKSDDKPTGENDPDKEVEEWEWIDVREGLPDEVKGKLHNGKHDITLQILGLLEGETNVELSKSWKHAFVGAMTAASLSGSPAMAQDAVTDDHHQDWSPEGLDEELKPIAHLESSFGKKMKHSPHSKGEYHTAFGAVGLKGITAHEEYKHTKYLQQIYPDLYDQNKFMETFKSNPTFYNAVATAHWKRLKKLFGGDVDKTAYAWRWGQGRAAGADAEAISSSPYIQGYHKIYDNIRGQQVALVNPLEKKVQEWLSKSMDRPAMQRLVLYDLGEDPFGHLEPTARHTDDGTFYEAVEFADVSDKLKRLGYHGYHDPESGHPVIFPEFQHLAQSTIH